MFSYSKKSKRAVARDSEGRVLYLHDVYNLPKITGNEKKDDKNYEPYFETDELPLKNFYEILPETRKNQTDRMILAAGSGAGKSTFICNYLKIFYETFPTAPETVLFTQQKEGDFDQAYKEIKDKMMHIVIDESLLDEPITLEDLRVEDEDEYMSGTSSSSEDEAEAYEKKYKPRVIVFDDFEAIADKKLSHAVKSLVENIQKNGRKLNLHIILALTTLPIKDGFFREMVGNSTKVILFPDRLPFNTKWFLERYFEMSEAVWNLCKRAFSSRWVCVTRNEQPYILYETACMIFNPDRASEDAKKINRIKNKIENKTTDAIIKSYIPKNS